jgi:hypothetical protein
VCSSDLGDAVAVFARTSDTFNVTRFFMDIEGVLLSQDGKVLGFSMDSGVLDLSSNTVMFFDIDAETEANETACGLHVTGREKVVFDDVLFTVSGRFSAVGDAYGAHIDTPQLSWFQVRKTFEFLELFGNSTESVVRALDCQLTEEFIYRNSELTLENVEAVSNGTGHLVFLETPTVSKLVMDSLEWNIKGALNCTYDCIGASLFTNGALGETVVDATQFTLELEIYSEIGNVTGFSIISQDVLFRQGEWKLGGEMGGPSITTGFLFDVIEGKNSTIAFEDFFCHVDSSGSKNFSGAIVYGMWWKETGHSFENVELVGAHSLYGEESAIMFYFETLPEYSINDVTIILKGANTIQAEVGFCNGPDAVGFYYDGPITFETFYDFHFIEQDDFQITGVSPRTFHFGAQLVEERNYLFEKWQIRLLNANYGFLNSSDCAESMVYINFDNNDNSSFTIHDAYFYSFPTVYESIPSNANDHEYFSFEVYWETGLGMNQTVIEEFYLYSLGRRITSSKNHIGCTFDLSDTVIRTTDILCFSGNLDILSNGVLDFSSVEFLGHTDEGEKTALTHAPSLVENSQTCDTRFREYNENMGQTRTNFQSTFATNNTRSTLLSLASLGPEVPYLSLEESVHFGVFTPTPEIGVLNSTDHCSILFEFEGINELVSEECVPEEAPPCFQNCGEVYPHLFTQELHQNCWFILCTVEDKVIEGSHWHGVTIGEHCLILHFKNVTFINSDLQEVTFTADQKILFENVTFIDGANRNSINFYVRPNYTPPNATSMVEMVDIRVENMDIHMEFDCIEPTAEGNAYEELIQNHQFDVVHLREWDVVNSNLELDVYTWVTTVYCPSHAQCSMLLVNEVRVLESDYSLIANVHGTLRGFDTQRCITWTDFDMDGFYNGRQAALQMDLNTNCHAISYNQTGISILLEDLYVNETVVLGGTGMLQGSAVGEPDSYGYLVHRSDIVYISDWHLSIGAFSSESSGTSYGGYFNDDFVVQEIYDFDYDASRSSRCTADFARGFYFNATVPGKFEDVRVYSEMTVLGSEDAAGVFFESPYLPRMQNVTLINDGTVTAQSSASARADESGSLIFTPWKTLELSSQTGTKVALALALALLMECGSTTRSPSLPSSLPLPPAPSMAPSPLVFAFPTPTTLFPEMTNTLLLGASMERSTPEGFTTTI